MTSQEIIKLLQSYANGTLTDDQKRQLALWKVESPDNLQIIELLDQAEGKLVDLGKMFSYDQDRVWNTIKSERRKHRIRKFIYRPAKYAAVVALMFMAGWGANAIYNSQKNQYDHQVGDLNTFIENIPQRKSGATLKLATGQVVELGADVIPRQNIEKVGSKVTTNNSAISYQNPSVNANTVENIVSVPNGKDYQLTLSDGTKVRLNSGSSITYPARFDTQVREVIITGEVYFDVAKDEKCQFIVRAGDTRIKVYGTSFNVMSYEDEPAIQTTLVSGSVEIESRGRAVRIKPGTQASVPRSSGAISVREVDTSLVTAWMNGEFVFENETIAAICRKLARWYNIDIAVTGYGVETTRYSGNFQQNSTLNEIINLFKLTNEIRIEVKDAKMTLEVIGQSGR